MREPVEGATERQAEEKMDNCSDIGLIVG